jgi:hypothetical protein
LFVLLVSGNIHTWVHFEEILRTKTDANVFDGHSKDVN